MADGVVYEMWVWLDEMVPANDACFYACTHINLALMMPLSRHKQIHVS